MIQVSQTLQQAIILMLWNPFRVQGTSVFFISPGNSTSLRLFHNPGLLIYNPLGVSLQHLRNLNLMNN